MKITSTSADEKSWGPIAAAAAWAIVVAGVGGSLTEIGPWYQALKKPFFQPPDWAFGPAWTLIFAFSIAAAATAWRAAPDARSRGWIIALYMVNGVLNVLWSVLFFKLRRPDWALIEVAFLWLSVLAMILVIRRYSARAGTLLVPYLAWVSFAAAINAAAVQLNAPF